LGCAQSQVSKRLALLELPETAQAAVHSGRLAVSDATEILRLRKYPQDMAELVEELLGEGGPMWTGERLRAVVDGELAGIEGRENRRRLLGQAEARGARILDPARGELPPYPERKLLHQPEAIDAAGRACMLGAYVGADGRVCYLDLVASGDEPATDAVLAEPDDRADDWVDEDGDGPAVVSGGGITVRRVNLDQPMGIAAVAAEARREAAADREQRDAAELARDEVCQRLVAGFAADPSSALPFLAGHVVTDTAGDGYSYPDTAGWRAG
jgi:hypothetical protein